MSKPQNKLAASIFVAVFLVSVLGATFVTSVSAETTGNPTTLGVWHLDKIAASGDNVITPDATGVNDGFWAAETQPALVDGEFDKALSFSGSSFVYVPISFLIGFPPTPQPIYVPISPKLNIQDQIKIDAWINFQGYTNATYDNIVVKCTRRTPLGKAPAEFWGSRLGATDNEDGARFQQQP
jgi:hypothetical protein